ncbi:hypothetical protein LguiB_008555 [Lonicera macranthoides]
MNICIYIYINWLFAGIRGEGVWVDRLGFDMRISCPENEVYDRGPNSIPKGSDRREARVQNHHSIICPSLLGKWKRVNMHLISTS